MYPEFRQISNSVPRCRKFRWHLLSFQRNGRKGRHQLDRHRDISTSMRWALMLCRGPHALTMWGLRPWGRDAHLGGSCVMRAELPQPARPSIRPSRMLPPAAWSQRHCCQSENPPRCPMGTAAQPVWVAPSATRSHSACLSVLGATCC